MIRFVCLAVAIFLTSGMLTAETSEAAETVQYRCVNWKKRHEHNQKQADQIVDTLKKLKCEVKVNPHNGHVDIAYRCPEWLEHTTDSHDNAHKLQNWLKALGFETKHEH